MKVGTDGVLVGAWANPDGVGTILDVGTGSGLIALMLAQRCENKPVIDAIELDADAVEQARDNIANSPYGYIRCIHASLQQYEVACERKYDLIISNPPYFSSSLLPPDKQRLLARHDCSLSVDELFGISSRLLTEKGKIALIFPYNDNGALLDIAYEYGLYPTRITYVYPLAGSLPKRVLMEFSRERGTPLHGELAIEASSGEYTSEFVALVKDFYLKL
jgi:tRNA1Val (adenine37-N6)-methyltransferase